MTVPQASQDDYYASQNLADTTPSDQKKPLKLKIKAVGKKTETKEVISTTPEKPLKVIKKVSPSESDPVQPTETPTVKERPKARLVEREHAGNSLLKSIMQKKPDSSTREEVSQKEAPKISFGSTTTFKPLENRPVMQVADDDRHSRRRNFGKNTSANTTPRPKTSSDQGSNHGQSAQQSTRLRDDSKPIFQRDIGYATPVRDGSTKKSGKSRPADRQNFDESRRRSVKTIGGADDGFRRGHQKGHKKAEKSLEDVKQVLVDRTGQEVSIGALIPVKEFSDKIGVPVAKVMGALMQNGVLVNLNAPIDFDTAFIIGESFGIKIIREVSEDVSVSDLMDGNIGMLVQDDDADKLVERAPIISIMGHVDHGKTSILDYIRKSSVASGEAGGITQKIGAYQVVKNDRKITFLDTPGHEAFTIMRARGAKLTDIAIIVIAADEGMKPQTIESINHAREAGVPIIVAANKMDKPGANLDLIRGQMAEHGLQPEDWGGDVVLVPVSAHTGLGIDTLLDMILLQADMLELKANPERGAVATVIEARLDQKLGSVATILVNTGTIRKGDNIACAGAYGKVRTLKDYKGKNILEAGPSTPVQITGLSEVVQGGDILQVLSTPEVAATRAKEYTLAKNTKSIHGFEGASLAMLMGRLKSGALKQLKIVLKTDSNGSLEALKSALGKLSTPETQVVFIHAAVGDVNQSDVMMAGTSQALLIAYNVHVLPAVKGAVAQSKIEFIDKKVIYHIIEKVESIITGMIDIRYEEQELGIAQCKAIFYTGKNHSMMIIGLGVLSGRIENKAKVRVIRDEKKAGSGEVVNLKIGPLDVNEVEEGNECGINFKGDVTILEGDKLEFYKMVQRK